MTVLAIWLLPVAGLQYHLWDKHRRRVLDAQWKLDYLEIQNKCVWDVKQLRKDFVQSDTRGETECYCDMTDNLFKNATENNTCSCDITQ